VRKFFASLRSIELDLSAFVRKFAKIVRKFADFDDVVTSFVHKFAAIVRKLALIVAVRGLNVRKFAKNVRKLALILLVSSSEFSKVADFPAAFVFRKAAYIPSDDGHRL
jgi:hypothetical protein